MTEEARLLRSIASTLEDDAPRLAYADWLYAHNDPRGIFIRAQCQLARMKEGSKRYELAADRNYRLYDKYQDQFQKPFKDLGVIAVEFTRGLASWIYVSPEIFCANAAMLFKLSPALCRLRLCKVPSDIPSFAQMKGLRRISSLCVESGFDVDNFEDKPKLNNTGLKQLADSPNLINLEVLDLHDHEISDSGIEALASSPICNRLTRLVLRNNLIGNSGLKALANSPRLRQLKSLDIVHNRIGNSGCVALAAAPWLKNFSELYLTRNPISGQGIAALAKSPLVSGLNELDLSETKIGDAGLAAIARSPHFANLTLLCVVVAGCGDAGVQSLAESHNLPRLEKLNLSGNLNIGDASMNYLARTETLVSLSVLQVLETGVGNAGVAALAKSVHLNGLRQLDLSGCREVNSEGARALAAATGLEKLNVLNLSHTRLSDKGAASLAKATGLAELEILNLSHTRLTDKGAASLAKATGLKKVKMLEINDIPITTRTHNFLIKRFGNISSDLS